MAALNTVPNPNVPQHRFWNNFWKRMLSSLIIIPIVLGAVYAGGMVFTVLVTVCGAAMAFEWLRMIRHRPKDDKVLWSIIGAAWILIPILSLYYIENMETGYLLVYWLLLVVITTDTAAYAVGTIVGGPKLIPRVSPGKTWSGAIGGIVFASIASVIYGVSIGGVADRMLLLGIIFSVIAQISDLLESAIKRHFGIKDTGAILPGHGGMIDRTDSLVLTAPAVALYMMYVG